MLPRGFIKAMKKDRNWAKILAFSVATCIFGYFAAANSVANITRRKSPDIALMVSGAEPMALTLKADREFQVTQTPKALVNVEEQAKRALRRQAHNATAIRLLGYVADSRGDRQAARRLIDMAARFSRREFGAQLWLIEDASQKEQLARALTHYDIALRTTTDSRGILFSTLIDALARQDVREAFTPYVAKAPTWMLDFISQAIAQIENPSNLALVMMAAKNSVRIPEYRDFPNLLLSQLESRGKYADYRRYYLSLPEVEMSLLTSLDMKRSSVTNRYPSVGWQLFDGVSVGSNFVIEGSRPGLRLQAYASPNGSGLVARKLLFLAPGSYTLAVQYTSASAGSGADLTWQIQCLSESGQVDTTITNRAVIEGKFSTSDGFMINSGCAVQYINLIVTDGTHNRAWK